VGADPLNAVLDLLSSLLARDLGVAIRRHGLHAGFSVLHSAADGVEALVFDLMEEFRAPIIEACALALFGRKALDKGSFSLWGEGEKRMWRLTREGYAACIRGHEAWLARPVRGQRSGHEMLWRGVFEEQALSYADHCRGGPTYVPYRLDY
jgi:CRISP-associated protein Cas1